MRDPPFPSETLIPTLPLRETTRTLPSYSAGPFPDGFSAPPVTFFVFSLPTRGRFPVGDFYAGLRRTFSKRQTASVKRDAFVPDAPKQSRYDWSRDRIFCAPGFNSDSRLTR